MANRMMAGDLRCRITIQKIIYANNANGFPVASAPTTVCTCWAAARDLSVSKSFDAATEAFHSVTEFTIRYRTDATEGMFVLLGGDTYKIMQVNQGDYGREYLVLAGAKVEKVSG
jgi:SPP1 family predicted phage head-tail adaptor